MPSSVSLYVAIHDDGGIYKHWSLFIDGPSASDKTIFQAMGSSGRYRFETENSNPRLWETLAELFYVCDVDESDTIAVKNTAKQVPIRDESPSWNCQDYVLDLLDALEEGRVIEGEDAGYQRRKSDLRRKQDGLI